MQHLPWPDDLPPDFESPRPISVTFIPATVFDNPALLRVNPEYFAWLLSLPLLERERLLGGNWKDPADCRALFQRLWRACSDRWWGHSRLASRSRLTGWPPWAAI
jgi:hypothetical protein